MSKGFLYSLAFILVSILVFVFVSIPTAYSSSIIKMILIILMPVFFIVALINYFKHNNKNNNNVIQTTEDGFSRFLRISVKTLGYLIIPLILLPIILVFYSIKFGNPEDMIGTFAIVFLISITFPIILLLAILYLIKASRERK